MSVSTLNAKPETAKAFNATINVAGLAVSPGVMTGGTEPDENVVTLTTRDEVLSFTPAEALAVSAALSSVAVHLMEQNEVAA